MPLFGPKAHVDAGGLLCQLTCVDFSLCTSTQRTATDESITSFLKCVSNYSVRISACYHDPYTDIFKLSRADESRIFRASTHLCWSKLGQSECSTPTSLPVFFKFLREVFAFQFKFMVSMDYR